MYFVELKESQVIIIEEHLRCEGFGYEPIREDILDHVCMATGNKMQQGLSFMDAFNHVKDEFGSTGLRALYLETTRNLNKTTMVKNYLISSWRNLRRQKMYTGVSILGLTLGLSIFISMLLYSHDELSYDLFHGDHVYRVSAHVSSNGQVYDEAASQFPLADELKTSVGVEATVRIHQPYTTPLLRKGAFKSTEDRFYYSDNSFFQVFGHRLIKGDPQTALTNPNSIVLTMKAARRYFGDQDPMGQRIEFVEEGYTRPLKVTGIIENRNDQSHFRFDMLVPIQFLFNKWEARFRTGGAHIGWYWTGAWTYFKLADPSYLPALKERLPMIVDEHFPDKWKADSFLELIKVEAIHLQSNKLAEIGPNGSLRQIQIFGAVGSLVLLIAIINFINLMSAQGFGYARQIGVRKFLGALRIDIIHQYVIEATLLSIISGVVALGLVQFIILPELNEISGKDLSLLTATGPLSIVLYFLGLLVLGFLAGLYPAITLSLVDSLSILKGTALVIRGVTLRQTFVVLQFIVSVVLIISVFIINKQNEYLKNLNTGFNKENIVVIKSTEAMNERLDAFKEQAEKIPGVSVISGVLDLPGKGTSSLRFVPEGRPIDQPEQLPLSYSDADLLELANLELISGRFFDKDNPQDPDRAFVINESAAKLFGWDGEASGKGMQMYAPGSSEIGKKGRIIGVIKDFNFESLHHPIRPLVITMNPNLDYYLVKYQGADLGKLTEQLRATWQTFESTWPMESFLLDQHLASLYEKEEKMSSITGYAMAFALLIAVIGIFGLSSYLLNKRTKEIGLRRVLGSSHWNSLVLLSRNFLFLVLIANVLAWPLAYLLMRNWLNNFEYHVDQSFTLFVLSSLITVILAFLAVIYHAIKISWANPIESLRYE